MTRFLPFSLVLLCISLLSGCLLASGDSTRTSLPDLSGVALIDERTLLAVHDAKSTMTGVPRVSAIDLTDSGRVASIRRLKVDWPGGISNDLESIAAIPGTKQFLLAESGSDGSAFQRLFLVAYERGRLRVEGTLRWPHRVLNVEGTAVVRAGNRMWLVFAERAHGKAETFLEWAPLSLSPLRLGAVEQSVLRLPGWTGEDARPVSALEIDSTGQVYVSSAKDAGNQGPFASAVWKVGRFSAGSDGRLSYQAEVPVQLARMDGLKIEGLVVEPGGSLLVSTDDEALGSVIRRIRPEAAPAPAALSPDPAECVAP